MPPWDIDDADRTQPRQRSEREQPRLEMPCPPKLARSDGDEPEAAQVIIVVHGALAGLPGGRLRRRRTARSILENGDGQTEAAPTAEESR